MRSAAFSAIMIVAALVFPRTTVSITEASTTRRPSRPSTLSSLSTTEPMAQVDESRGLVRAEVTTPRSQGCALELDEDRVGGRVPDVLAGMMLRR